MSPIQAYLLIFLGVIVGGIIFSQFKKLNHRFLDAINVFGGAFLLGVCFLQLVPHLFEHNVHSCDRIHTGNFLFSIPVGTFVLVGFIIQLLLENLSKGIEHGHSHTEPHVSPKGLSLLIGLSLHAFLEGMPIVSHGEHIHEALIWGIFIHNIPITMVLTTILIEADYPKWKRYLFLFIFAVMSPLGSIVNRVFSATFGGYDTIIMALVIGILLHVSVSILFTHEDRGTRFSRILIILLAFALAYVMPACSH